MTVTQVGIGVSQGEVVPTNSAETFVDQFCFDGKLHEMDVSDIVDVYTEKTNEYFNEKIEYIMTHVDDVADTPSPSLNDYPTLGGSLCRDSNGVEQNDMTCQSIAVCNPTSGADISAHPFCMAVTLMGVSPIRASSYNWDRIQEIEPLKYSYFCYKSALEKKRDAVFDSTPQAILAKCDGDFADEEICKLKDQIAAEKDPEKKADLQDDLDYELNQKRWWSNSGAGALSSATLTLVDVTDSAARRIQFIDEEIDRAKIAMDQTLDAYSQLKSAWQMHVKYMDIFAELVKYRDHLVAIRKQTDVFPFRFIDATTTKCL